MINKMNSIICKIMGHVEYNRNNKRHIAIDNKLRIDLHTWHVYDYKIFTCMRCLKTVSVPNT